MSAFEPQLPSEPKVDMPDFMIVLRGFDRRQVEMWAAEVASQIEQERLRADEAEKRAYRAQIETSGAPSFSHLGSHVASILEEAGKSSENMLADAAERAQEAIDAAEEEAAEIIKAAEHRAGEIEGDARRTLEEAQAEGARVEEDALQAAEEMRAQAEQDARAVLEEARDATDMIWQEAERERLVVEAETIRLETLRHRSLEQLGRVYGHLESVLDEVRAGIGRVEEEEQDLAEATAAAAARLGVEPPASSPEDSPRFPDHRVPAEHDLGEADGDEDDEEDDDGEGMLSATRPDTPSASAPSTGITPGASSSATDTAPGTSGSPTATAPASTTASIPGATAPPPSATPASTATAPGASGLAADTAQPQQAALTDADAAADRSANGGTDATQPIVANGSTDATTQTVPAATAGPNQSAAGGLAPEQDATQRLEPIEKPRNPKAAPGKEGKPRT